MSQQDEQQDPCRWENTDFKQCLTRYNDDIASCQQFYDSLQACRRRTSFCFISALYRLTIHLQAVLSTAPTCTKCIVALCDCSACDAVRA